MDDISNELNLPEPIKFDEKILKKMSVLKKKGENIFSDIDSDFLQSLTYLYLLKKYKSDCFLYNENDDFRLLGLEFIIRNKETKVQKKMNEEHINVIAKAFIECLDKNIKIIIVPIIIDHIDENVAHSNVLIYRKKYNEIEHFEPHGAYFNLDKKEGNKMKNIVLRFINASNELLKENKKKQIKFIPSNEVCPAINGLQALEAASILTKPDGSEEEGYCAIWNNFFTEVCLRNPDMKSSEIMDILFKFFKNKKNIEDYLRKIIRGYSGMLGEIINKYISILFGDEISVDKINELINDEDVDVEKYSEIRRMLLELFKLEAYLLTDKNFNIEDEMNRIDIEIRKNKFYKNLTKDEKISLLIKKKILENYEKFNEVNLNTLTEDSKTELLSSILDNFGESQEEIASTIDDIKTLSIKSNKNKTEKSSIVSILSEKSFQPNKRRKGKNVIKTETETEESEEETIKPIKTGKRKNIIETETESDTKDDSIKFPSLNLDTINIKSKTISKTITKPFTKTASKIITKPFTKTDSKTITKPLTKLKSKTSKISKKNSSKSLKNKKSSIRIRGTSLKIDEERCPEGKMFDPKEWGCVDIKSRKIPKTKINIYSIKSKNTN
jgi:hypothetical protein